MAARDWDDKSELGFSKDEFNAASNVVSKGGKYDGQVDEGIRPEEDLHRRLKPRQIAMYWIVTANNLVAAAIVVTYWTNAVPVGAWLAIYLGLNLLGIKVFGELEFWASFLKVITLTGLIIVGLVIDLGGAPGQERLGFRYWKEQPFSHYIFQNKTGVFLGVWSCMVTALFAYSGTELVGVTFAEAANPRKTVPATVRRTFARILIFYVGSIFVVGLLVKATDPALLATTKKATSAAASPFVLAIERAQIKVLPDIINGAILLFVLSAANSDLYIGTRTLYGLAAQGQAPRILMRTNRFGTPYWCTAVCSLVSCICFLAVSKSAKTVFGYFVSLVTLYGALTWLSILGSHIAMMRAMKAQGISRDELPYKSPMQPYMTYWSFGLTAVVTFFKGFDSFTPKFTKTTFVTNYIGIPIYAALYIGYKVWFRTNTIKPAEVDFVTGRREFDEDEAMWAEQEDPNKPWWKKAWDGA
ncbi:hypothetical protein BMF94_6078 [Rhodotorula taiwanensis]|uniref:Amino acid permease/ SLC12A domain-containing protein n=1 Tax=Rhodotorula taiwanensis TaxID=741276 RepID=A0A2S5B2A7_9BASI|nr:hypothetical protein BMF94_6078 [Rhodotorula taiwanensis]